VRRSLWLIPVAVALSAGSAAAQDGHRFVERAPVQKHLTPSTQHTAGNPASVAWWSEGQRATTFGHLVARVLAETAQHAGHCDIVRELIDGRAGRDSSGIGDEQWWESYVARVQAAADAHREDAADT